MNNVILRKYQASDAPWVIEQHSALYARDEGFDDSFGTLVGEILDDFIAQNDPTRDYGWIAERGGERLGSVFCVGAGADTAKLRLFLLTPAARGHGLGKQLLQASMDFARKTGNRQMVLWTHESHLAACALYAQFGWELIASKAVRSFGVDLVEQSWRVAL